MKRIIALALLCALSGCAQSHFPAEITEKAVLINTPEIIAEMASHE